MNYKLKKATKNDISRLTNYKLRNIFEYAEKLSKKEIMKINDYVKEQIPVQLENYKIIKINNKKIGCLLILNKDDGILLDEIYLEENYRNKGIGTNIIQEVISKNNIIYLWVYKLNKKAIPLYEKFGFQKIEETKNRYYMKYSKPIEK